MINKINPNINNSFKSNKTTIIYVNDLHGQLTNAEKLQTGWDSFSKNSKQHDIIRVSAGDMFIGAERPKNNFIAQYLNELKLDAAVLGNHALDMGTKQLSETLKKTFFKFVGTNIDTSKACELNNNIKNNKIVKSTIIEKNGNKYGILGLSPTGLKDRLAAKAFRMNHGFNTHEVEQTKQDLKQEISKLKAQNIDKIILVSHYGYEKDVEIAKNVSDIDVIIGAHTHNLLKGLAPGKNIINSPDGKPVLITQAGKNGKYFGVLDIIFDDKGEIKAANNNVMSTKDIPKSLKTKALEDIYMGKPLVIGYAKQLAPRTDIEFTESQFLADSMKHLTGAQVAFSNKGSARGTIHSGEITDRELVEIYPFENLINKIKVSEKDIVETLKKTADTELTTSNRPGILQVSGMNYTVDKNMKLLAANIENPDGTQTPLNIQNPSEGKIFTAAVDDFLLSGAEHFENFKRSEGEFEQYSYKLAPCVINYVKSFNNKPIELQPKGNIIVQK